MLTITLYEQSAFTLGWDDCLIADNFGVLSPSETLDELDPVEAVLVTHIHPDHFHEPYLQRLNAPVYTVGEVTDAISDPAIQATAVMAGETFDLADTGFRVTAVPSDHGPKPGPVENVGYVIKGCGKTLYYLGDMKLFTPPPTGPFDVVLVPVGDNGGLVFNPEEAAAHIKAIGHTGLVIPVHYTRFPENATRFAELMKDSPAQVRILKPGQEFEL